MSVEKRTHSVSFLRTNIYTSSANVTRHGVFKTSFCYIGPITCFFVVIPVIILTLTLMALNGIVMPPPHRAEALSDAFV